MGCVEIELESGQGKTGKFINRQPKTVQWPPLLTLFIIYFLLFIYFFFQERNDVRLHYGYLRR